MYARMKASVFFSTTRRSCDTVAEESQNNARRRQEDQRKNQHAGTQGGHTSRPRVRFLRSPTNSMSEKGFFK